MEKIEGIDLKTLVEECKVELEIERQTNSRDCAYWNAVEKNINSSWQESVRWERPY